MNASRRTSVANAARWGMALQFVVMLMASPGCNMGKGAPPPEGQLAIESVATWYQLYRAANRGKVPANEEAFVAFVQKELEKRGDTLDRDQLLTSPRDKQKYMIQYGKPTSNNPEQNVAVYEQEGYGGKKLVAFEMGWSREVDEAELKSLLAGK